MIMQMPRPLGKRVSKNTNPTSSSPVLVVARRLLACETLPTVWTLTVPFMRGCTRNDAYSSAVLLCTLRVVFQSVATEASEAL